MTATAAGPDDSDWEEFDAAAATNEPFEAYGTQLRINDALLEQLAVVLNEDTVPLQGQHNPRIRIRHRNVRAWVECAVDSPLKRVRFTGEVLRADLDRAGPISGVSITIFQPIAEDKWTRPAKAVLTVAGDVGYFDDESLVQATAAIQARLDRSDVDPGQVGAVSVGRLYQFSPVHDALATFSATLPLLEALGPNLLAAAIWDGTKILYARMRGLGLSGVATVKLNLVTASGTVDATVRTDDPDIARAAIENISSAIALVAGSEEPNNVRAIWTTSEGSGWKELDN